MAEDTDNTTPSGVLAQSEVDLLLQSQGADKSAGRIYHANGPRTGTGASPKVETYDFRNPAFLTEVELDRLRTLHGNFIRYLSARISLFLRTELSIKLKELGTRSYSRFTDGLPGPTHICLFKPEPLMGVGILVVNPRFALALVDRMLGGRGQEAKDDRPLTEIETALLEDVMRIILEEWCAQWAGEADMKPQIIGHESTGRFLQTSSKDAVMLVLSIEADFSGWSGLIQIGVPCHTLEPVVKRQQAKGGMQSAAERPPANVSWKPIYKQIALGARAEWDAFELTLREVAHLRVGDVLEMPVDIVDRTRVLLAGTPKFIGTVGLDSDRVVVQLTNKIQTEDTPHA